jgi:FkbM family methyltransferase
LFWSQRLGLPFGRHGGHYTLRAREAAHPLQCRAGTSDADVFTSIFVKGGYACIDQVEAVDLVLDLGANVGYSAAYFLTRYPNAEVLAVEPDDGNYELLQLNMRPYDDRVKLSRSAVWSHETTLVIADDVYRDGREWSKQVREARPGETHGLPAVTIEGLLRDSGHRRISILKVDIEGAEAEIFSEGCESWLPSVDNILIELHDDSSFGDCSSVFFRAIADENFTVSELGTLTACTRER